MGRFGLKASQLEVTMKLHTTCFVIWAALCGIGFPSTLMASQQSDMVAGDEELGLTTVTSARLGSHVDSKQEIPVPKTLFRPNDDIALSIGTHTTGSTPITVTLGASWTYGAGENRQSVFDDSLELSVSGDHATAFTITNTRDWPEGQYQVELFLNGEPVRTLEFSVR